METIDIKKEILYFLQNNDFNYAEPTIYYLKDVIKYTVNYINKILEKYPNIKLLYATKANSNEEILKLLAPYVSGYDVASFQEFEKVRKCVSKKHYISATGYAFSKVAFSEIMNANVNIDFVSIVQIKTLGEYPSFKNKNIGIRINVPKSSFENIFEKKSRFGIHYETEARVLYKICCEKKVKIKRLHLHGGLKNCDNVKCYMYEIEKWIKLFPEIESVNLGGGWDYVVEQKKFESILSYITKKFPNMIFYIEPGNLLVRKSGILVSQIIDFHFNDKMSGVAVLDCSAFNLSSWYHPKIIATICSEREEIICDSIDFVGNTCYEEDNFRNISVKNIRLEDLVFLYPVGAYYHTTHRCLHDLPFPREKLL